MSPLSRILLLCMGLAGPLLGCALWTEPPGKPSELPAAKMPADSVVLEVAFVRIPAEVQSLDAAVWPDVDEQHLPTDLRRRLEANGLRCGLVGSQLPSELRGLLNRAENATPLANPNEASPESELATQQRLHCRAGRRAKIVASASRDQMVVLRSEDGMVRGETYAEAHGEFAVKTYPQGDGRVRLELTPEIHHGPVRQRIVGGDGMFRMEASRDRIAYENLRIEAMLSPGQVLLLSSTPDAKGLGGQFFSHPSADATRKWILIRLAQTQFEDLFAPEEILKPIVTPTQ